MPPPRDPPYSLPEIVRGAIEERGGDPETAIITDVRMEYAPTSAIQVENVPLTNRQEAINRLAEHVRQEAMDAFDAAIIRDLEAVARAPVGVLQNFQPYAPVEPIYEIGRELPVAYVHGRATGELELRGTQVNPEALARLLNQGEPGILRGQPQHVAMLDDAANFAQANANGDVFPPLTREGLQAIRDEIERQPLRMHGFIRQPLLLQTDIDRHNAESIRAAEDEQIFAALEAAASSELAPSWVINPADPAARVATPIRDTDPVVRAQRVTVPLMEIAANPSIPISSTRERRFDILERAPAVFKSGEWVTLKRSPDGIYKVIDVSDGFVSIQLWDEEAWQLTGLIQTHGPKDCVHTSAPVRNIWTRLSDDEDLF